MDLQYALPVFGRPENPYMFRCLLPAKSRAGCTTAQDDERSDWDVIGKFRPALDFSHSNLAFCHPRIASKMVQHTRHIERTTSLLGLLGRADALIGGLICGLAAAAASVIAAGYTWRVFVPLIFTLVLVVVARIFGARAGIAGTALAALVFSMLLFNPLGKMQVSDAAARTNLGWMLLIGLTFSFLFAPPTSGCRRQ